MKQDNKNKKIIGISLGVVGALLLIFSGTYAYWQLTKEQSSANEIVAACLDFELSDVTEAISLERAYPISEAESESLTGYTFKVKNNCSDNIDYTIGLNSITNNSENYLDNSSLRVKLDNGSSRIYETLNDIEYIENVRYSKELGTSTILGNSENTHLLKVWVDENAPVTEQGKTFTGKIIITGSVGNTSNTGEEQIADSCFEIGNDGTILSYDYSCGTDIVVPAEINGIQVKKIEGYSFNESDIVLYTGYYEGYDSHNNMSPQPENIWYIKNTSKKSAIINNLKEQLCDDSNICTINDLETALSEASSQKTTIILSTDEYNAYDFSKYESIGVEMIVATFTPFQLLSVYDSINHIPRATSVNLSNAIYLETLMNGAFYGKYYSFENIDGACEYDIYSEEDNAPIYICKGKITRVDLPLNGVLTVLDDCFGGNRIEKIKIPESVTHIGSFVFSDNLLTKLIIPNRVTFIGKLAFEGNPLTEVIIRRTNETGIEIRGDSFPDGVTPIYDPNYTE